MELQRGHDVEIRVVDAAGAPLAGVALVAHPAQHALASNAGAATTDAAGRATISGLPEDDHRVEAIDDTRIARGADTVRVTVPRPAGAPALEIVLEAGGSIAGRVVDASGAGVEGVEVSVAPAWTVHDARNAAKRATQRETVTSTGGRFRVSGLGDGPFAAKARARDVSVVERSPIESGGEPVEIVLPPATGFAGRVVDLVRRAPVESFRVYAIPSHATPSLHTEQRSAVRFASSDGAFELRGLEPGRYRAVVAADGYVRAVSAEVTVAAGSVARGVVVELEPAAVVRGSVIDAASGAPFAGAVVNVRTEPAGAKLGANILESSGMTGRDGSFEIHGVPAGSALLHVNGDQRFPATSGLLPVRAGETTVFPPIALEASAAVTLEARAPDGSPLVREPIHFELTSAGNAHMPRGATATLWTNEHGGAAFDGLAAGTWFAEIEDRPETRVQVELRGGETTRVTIVGAPGDVPVGTVAVTVRRGGEPLANVEVSLWPENDRKAEPPKEALTDVRGRARFEDAPAGRGSIRADLGDWSIERRIEVPPAGEREVVIDLAKGGALRGRVVRRPDGGTLEGVQIEAQSSGGDARAHVETDVEGRFELEDLPPGEWRLLAHSGQRGAGPTAELLAPVRRKVDVVQGETREVELAMEEGGRVVVEAIGVDGAPAPSAPVLVASADDERGGRTDATGNALLDRIGPGTWRATAWFRDAPCAHAEVRVESGRESRVRVQAVAGVPLRVRAVDKEGRAVGLSRVTVTAIDGRPVARWWSDEPRDEVRLSVSRGTLRVEVAAGERKGSADVTIGEGGSDVAVRMDG